MEPHNKTYTDSCQCKGELCGVSCLLGGGGGAVG